MFAVCFYKRTGTKISHMTTYSKPAMTPANNTQTLSNLNGIRLLVVLYIAFGYCSTLPLGPEYPELLHMFGYDPSWVGIQVLFFISGLLAMRSFQAGRTGLTYLRSRFGRNIPLLFTLTLATLIILFPLFGTPLDEGKDFFKRLIKYVLVTTFCISPGQPIQGLMDDAKYMCLIQGGIWTLRYGAILHIMTALTGKLGWVSKKRLLFCVTILTILAYIFVGIIIDKNSFDALTPALTGLRLASAFILGLSAWACKDTIYRMGQKVWIFPFVLFAIAFLNYNFAPPSALIDISLSGSFMAVAWIALKSKSQLLTFLHNCPDLTLPVMLICWPVAQTFLLLSPDLSPLALILLTLPVTLALSVMVRGLASGVIIRFTSFKSQKTKTS